MGQAALRFWQGPSAPPSPAVSRSGKSSSSSLREREAPQGAPRAGREDTAFQRDAIIALPMPSPPTANHTGVSLRIHRLTEAERRRWDSQRALRATASDYWRMTAAAPRSSMMSSVDWSRLS